MFLNLKLYSSIVLTEDDHCWSKALKYKYLKFIMYFITIALLFLLKLRFPPHRSLTTTILNRYGRDGLRLYRQHEKLDYKLRKAKADLDFLLTCQTHNLKPKFLNFITSQTKDRQVFAGLETAVLPMLLASTTNHS